MATFQLSYKAKGDAAAQYCGGVRNTMRERLQKRRKKCMEMFIQGVKGQFVFNSRLGGGRYVLQGIPFIFVSSSETLPS